MQPYFFPYLGYFQLIKEVDIYVNLDHVSFMKRSYMTRNVLKNNISININVSGGSQNKSCTEVKVLDDKKWWSKFYKTLDMNYKKSSNYSEVITQIIDPLCYGNQNTISEFNLNTIKLICNYLDIKTKFIDTSEGITTHPKNKGLQDITKHFGGTTYINAIGGQKLYNKKDFASQDIDLKFIQMDKIEVDNQYASILDLLFRYNKEHLKQQLNKYILI